MNNQIKKKLVSRTDHFLGICFILCVGIFLFVLQLGNTGLIDETPPLFAAASRAMERTGDWLTPRVNGLPRFDKPPLVYWLMGIGYSLPGNNYWDPLGTWAARLPSAISSILTMLVIGDTVMRWPQGNQEFPRRQAVIASITFGLSPLVLVWGRAAVSDALLCSTLAIALIMQWRNYAYPSGSNWWLSWIVLGLAVLTKGPVAIILVFLTHILFAIFQKDFLNTLRRLRLFKGLIITFLVSFPWYFLELIVEGRPFFDSFFGYHNLQRFTSVVNSHNAPIWFFGLVLVAASLPFTLFLILGIYKILSEFFRSNKRYLDDTNKSLRTFCFCWLLAVFLFFTFSATKLPSYWLPATPAASMIIAFASFDFEKERDQRLFKIAWIGTLIITLAISCVMWISPLWIPSINDPEIPGFGKELLNSHIGLWAAFFFSSAFFVALFFNARSRSGVLLAIQIPLIFAQLFVLLPLLNLADRARQKPIRDIAEMIIQSKNENEPIAMVGAIKPSLHFYTDQVIVFEGRSKIAFVNLVDRIKNEKRQGWEGVPIKGINQSKTALVVIDDRTVKNRFYWNGLEPEILAKKGVYNLWRLDRNKLERRYKELVLGGSLPNWRGHRKERF